MIKSNKALFVSNVELILALSNLDCLSAKSFSISSNCFALSVPNFSESIKAFLYSLLALSKESWLIIKLSNIGDVIPSSANAFKFSTKVLLESNTLLNTRFASCSFNKGVSNNLNSPPPLPLILLITSDDKSKPESIDSFKNSDKSTEPFFASFLRTSKTISTILPLVPVKDLIIAAFSTSKPNNSLPNIPKDDFAVILPSVSFLNFSILNFNNSSCF